MARTSTYLNFGRDTEAAFNFYRKVFGGKFNGKISRMGEVPTSSDQPKISKADKNLIMHISLTILGGHVLLGTDAPESMGFKLNQGNNVYINLEPDTKEETDQLFKKLSVGAKIEMPLQMMFWGDYFGSLKDKFGIMWMFNCSTKK